MKKLTVLKRSFYIDKFIIAAVIGILIILSALGLCVRAAFVSKELAVIVVAVIGVILNIFNLVRISMNLYKHEFYLIWKADRKEL